MDILRENIHMAFAGMDKLSDLWTATFKFQEDVAHPLWFVVTNNNQKKLLRIKAKLKAWPLF